ncbi:BppU family phage baseplate upper protein [Galactobacillus timonensis]|uniref:BppU family phage baseplate upper protein n=1 Tax=Galactobacillus timonensis TaxID=2041840 RepID=UPI000C854EB7|nr:BppU family phage baseplate upper protein [Galactobacillus timonensis]
MAIQQIYSLNMIPGGRTLIIPVSQYDNGARGLLISLTAGADPYTIPDGAAVTVRGTKRDGRGFAYACEYAGSAVSVTVRKNMTAVPGDVWCELRIATGENSADIVGSANFILRVEPAGLADETDISATEIPAIEDAARTQAERAEAAAKRAEEAGGVSVRKNVEYINVG